MNNYILSKRQIMVKLVNEFTSNEERLKFLNCQKDCVLNQI